MYYGDDAATGSIVKPKACLKKTIVLNGKSPQSRRIVIRTTKSRTSLDVGSGVKSAWPSPASVDFMVVVTLYSDYRPCLQGRGQGGFYLP